MVSRPRKPPEKARHAAEGAPFIQNYTVKLFDKGNGDAIEWPEAAGALLVAALACIDKTPDDPRTVALLHQMGTAAYGRLAGSPGAGIALPVPAGMAPPSLTPTRAPSIPTPHPKGTGRG